MTEDAQNLSVADVNDPPTLIDSIAPVVPLERRPMDHKLQPKKKTSGPIPARQKNGYYADHATGDRLRSVTTILSGGIPKAALMPWAAYLAADAAIEAIPQLVAASRNEDLMRELRNHIARAHTRKKDERAEVGSAVHAIIEARILNQPPPASVKVNNETWALDGPELAPYLAAFEAFEADWQPEWTASEMVVANPEHGYAGTLDYTIAASGLIGQALAAAGYEIDPSLDLLGDTKTGGELDTLTSSGHFKGVYPEAGLQMAAYRKASVAWLRSGERVLMPPTLSVGVVLHLRPEGYRLYPARCGDAEYAYFRHAQMVDEWTSRIASAKHKEPVVAPALALPGVEKKAVGA
jgi:hypothetical protein